MPTMKLLRISVLSLAIVAGSAGMTGCTITEGPNFQVTTGVSVYTEIYQRTTFVIVRVLWQGMCHWDYGCLYLKIHDYADSVSVDHLVHDGRDWFSSVSWINGSENGAYYCLHNTLQWQGNDSQWRVDSPANSASCHVGEWPTV